MPTNNGNDFFPPEVFFNHTQVNTVIVDDLIN